MRQDGWERIAAVMDERGMHVARRKPPLGFFMNIVGVRSHSEKPFGDRMHVFFRAETGWAHECFACSTRPSPWYLENPLSDAGTAQVLPGQYRGAYSFGVHKAGSPEAHAALCQFTGPVRVARWDVALGAFAAEDEGLFGLHIHTVPHSVRHLVDEGRWSAGCQVLPDPGDFARFLALCRLGRFARNGRFTYTLLDERDL